MRLFTIGGDRGGGRGPSRRRRPASRAGRCTASWEKLEKCKTYDGCPSPCRGALSGGARRGVCQATAASCARSLPLIYSHCEPRRALSDPRGTFSRKLRTRRHITIKLRWIHCRAFDGAINLVFDQLPLYDVMTTFSLFDKGTFIFFVLPDTSVRIDKFWNSFQLLITERIQLNNKLKL